MPNAIQDPLDRLSAIIEGEKSPFVELSERMKTTSKDIQNLNLSILDLAIALEKRAGVKTGKEKQEPKVEQNRNFATDVDDFVKGFADEFTKPFKNMKDYFTSKAEMPAAVDKIKTDDIDIEEKDNIKNTIVQQDNNQNKILSDMVEVLIDMRDDRSQKQLLDEAISIKKLILDQSSKAETSKGIEPNTEDSKQEDREKLAEAIARKLGDVLGDLGIGSNSGLGIPDFDKKPKSGGKTPSKAGTAGTSKFKIPPGAGKTAMLGGELLGGAGLALGAYEASEYLKETNYGDKMAEGAGKDAQKAFKENVAPTIDPIKAGVSKDEAIAALENGSTRDIEKLGGVEDLRKIAGLPPLEATQDTAPVVEQASLRKYDYIPETSPKVNTPPIVQPKTTETSVGNMLNKVSDQNTELKMLNTSSAEPQMLAPIISNKTINNTEQTMIASSPSPHSSASSFVKWQMSRSNYA
jgi:hypothetical protein